MVTTEVLIPIWAGTLALIGCFFGIRAARRRKREREQKEADKQAK